MLKEMAGKVVEDAIAKANQLDLCFQADSEQRTQVPFTFTPSEIPASTLSQLDTISPLLGRLTQTVASRSDLIQAVHQSLQDSDPFFSELLAMHRQLYGAGNDPICVPLLLQRSDFMVDAEFGPKLVECNSIAAGMAPFGEQVGKLHDYLKGRWPAEFNRFLSQETGTLITNPATENLANTIATAARAVAKELDDTSDPGFLMIVQEHEDNVFDQRLLEHQLTTLGLKTYRRTFRQLNQQLSSGPNHRLILNGCGTIHAVYLRAGYRYQDYIAADLDERRCCDALCNTRVFIEGHRVALNATVAQQLATSKKMQLYLAQDSLTRFSDLGFTPSESMALADIMTPMQTVEATSLEWLQDTASSSDWVLKNQGEGGGHCLFDEAIVDHLKQLKPAQYNAWTLMQRLRPAGRAQPTLIIRAGKAQQFDNLVGEIGVFTAHLGQTALPGVDRRCDRLGYLVRSKPPSATESGIHSGFGALDSLYVV